MAKYEKEIKVLDVDIDKVSKRLNEIGAKFKGKKAQKLYVYDIPTIYHRYLEIRELLKNENQTVKNANILKLKNLFLEYEDLVDDLELSNLLDFYQIKELSDLLQLDTNKLARILYDEKIEKSFAKFMNNPNKWVRLRQSNNEVTLTTKHIFEKNANDI